MTSAGLKLKPVSALAVVEVVEVVEWLGQLDSLNGAWKTRLTNGASK